MPNHILSLDVWTGSEGESAHIGKHNWPHFKAEWKPAVINRKYKHINGLSKGRTFHSLSWKTAKALHLIKSDKELC